MELREFQGPPEVLQYLRYSGHRLFLLAASSASQPPWAVLKFFKFQNNLHQHFYIFKCLHLSFKKD